MLLYQINSYSTASDGITAVEVGIQVGKLQAPSLSLSVQQALDIAGTVHDVHDLYAPSPG